MRITGNYRWCGMSALLLLLLGACGCASPNAGGAGGASSEGGALAALFQPGNPRPAGKSNGPNSAPAAAQQPQLPPPASSDQLAMFSNKLQATEDERKVLAARLQQMDVKLHDREKMLVLANYEVQEAARQVGQTREELKRWQQEMENLRAQLRSSEKENKGTLEAIIRTLEQFMDREKEVGTLSK